MSDSLLHTVNVAVQVLPFSNSDNTYHIVDMAIKIIQNSGIKYQVTPFETVMEGDYDQIMEVIKKVQQACYEAGAKQIICNLKIQSKKSEDVRIDEKTNKYNNKS